MSIYNSTFRKEEMKLNFTGSLPLNKNDGGKLYWKRKTEIIPTTVLLNMFLSIASFLGNTLILVALSKESSLHPPSKLLLRSLAATDLCVGIINQPLYVTHWFSVVYERWDICHSTTAH